MGKKGKIGKQRKDKFYSLAKEAGYRSRAAFKLLQLNRMYRFLESSKVCVDLCAAPGGWLQVALKNMPVSSLIIGIDLFPIRPIPNVLTFQEDITSDKCRSLLKRELKNMAADVFLHDGAPNIGMNWYHDAYKQNVLTLKALSLAVDFLREGGFFITKLFRSKDYFSLLWVLQQLFKKVDATKPQASRIESAEMFLICQGFLAPGKIDPKFFDPKFVFSDVDDCDSGNKSIDLFRRKKETRNREGYPDGDYTLYHEIKASEFIESDHYFDLLSSASVIVLDDEFLKSHPQTTAEVVECLKDIKILGKKELKLLINWRKKVRASVKKKDNSNVVTKDGAEEISATKQIIDNEDDDELQMNEAIYEAEQTQLKLAKSKKKKLLKQKRKLRDKLALKIVNPNDKFDIQDNDVIFDLKNIKTKKELRHIQNPDPDDVLLQKVDGDDDGTRKKPKKTPVTLVLSRDRANDPCDDPFLEPFLDDDASVKSGTSCSPSKKNDEHDEKVENDETDEEPGEENPLLVDIVHGSSENRKKSEAKIWFQNTAFEMVNDEIKDSIDDCIIDYMREPIIESSEDATHSEPVDAANVNAEDSPDNPFGADDGHHKKKKRDVSKKKVTFADDELGDSMEDLRLDCEGLAIGHVMAQSKKAREELIDDSYNRFSGFGDTEGLPSWFVKDEERHCRLPLPVPKEIIEEYKMKMKKINARPIKKVLEAKARKKHKAMKQLKRLNERIEAVPDNLDPKERGNQIAELYKKVRRRKKDHSVTYVVSKKGKGGKLPTRTKGRYKLVDRRMKKDKRKSMNKNITRKRSRKS